MKLEAMFNMVWKAFLFDKWVLVKEYLVNVNETCQPTANFHCKSRSEKLKMCKTVIPKAGVICETGVTLWWP